MQDQVFENGTFLFGDCLERMSDLAPNSVDMILCDLPYGEVSQKSSGLRLLDRGIADRCDIDLSDLVGQWRRICTGSVYAFCGTEQISALVELMRSAGFTTRVGAWNKTNPSPMNGSRLWVSGLEFCVFGRLPKATFNEHCKKALWDAPSGRAKIHPTEKPVALFRRLIEASTDEGMVVLDNCAGSGTTAIACEQAGRKWICVERDPEYFQMSVDRIRKYVVPDDHRDLLPGPPISRLL